MAKISDHIQKVERSILEATEDYDDIRWTIHSLAERLNEPSVDFNEVMKHLKSKRKK